MKRKIQFGLTLPFGPIELLLDRARIAEQVGFDTVWFPDHVVSPGNELHLDAWSVLSSIAISTKRVLLGPAVTDAVRRHPAFVAHCLLTLDQISKGRAILGLGAGEPMNVKPFGMSISQPLGQLREAIQIVRQLCVASVENPTSFNGKHYRLSCAFLGVRPYGNSTPPIYIGALGPKTRQLAGELGDGWLPYVQTTRTYVKLVQDVKSGAERGGRSLSDVDLAVNIPVYLTRGGNVPKQVFRRLAIRLVLEGNTLRDYGLDYPSSMTVNEMLVDSRKARELESLADTVPRDILEEVAVIGSPSEVVERLTQYARLGATHFLIRPLGEDVGGDLRILSESVIPQVSETNVSEHQKADKARSGLRPRQGVDP